MARFYAEIQGNRGDATRMGSAASGIYSHTRGWHTGARVDVDDINGTLVAEDGTGDRVDVKRTGGSNGGNAHNDSVGWVDDGPAFFTLNGVSSDDVATLAEQIGKLGDGIGSADLLREAGALLAKLAPSPQRVTS